VEAWGAKLCGAMGEGVSAGLELGRRTPAARGEVSFEQPVSQDSRSLKWCLPDSEAFLIEHSTKRYCARQQKIG
jgi:hypothetical protein